MVVEFGILMVASQWPLQVVEFGILMVVGFGIPGAPYGCGVWVP